MADMTRPKPRQLMKRLRHELKFRQKQMFFDIGERCRPHFYRRGQGARRHRPRLVRQHELARLAQPYYHRLREAARGTSRWPRTSTTPSTRWRTWCSPQAVRLHALLAVRRRAVGGDQPLQGHDLPADRDFGRGRNQRTQPGADGARRGQGQGQARIPAVLESTGRRLETSAPMWTNIPS